MEAELAASLAAHLGPSAVSHALKVGADIGDIQGESVEDMELEEALLNSEDGLGIGKAIPDTLNNPDIDIGFADTWREAAGKGQAILMNRFQSLQLDSPHYKPIGSNNDLTLVEMVDGRIVYAHNMTEENRWGRIADVDHEHRVKPIVCVGKKKNKIDFTKSVVIHPAIGTRMVRHRGSHKRPRLGDIKSSTSARPIIHPKIVRLSEMWAAARGHSLADGSQCEYCGGGNLQHETKQCWLCMLTSHQECATSLLNKMDSLEKHAGISSLTYTV